MTARPNTSAYPLRVAQGDRNAEPTTGHAVGSAGGMVAMLRGDDALSRAAAEVAAPRRRLLAGLRDAHAEACLRVDALRRCEEARRARPRPLPALLFRLLREAEEQFRRIEIALAHLHERPGGGLIAQGGSWVASPLDEAPRSDAALLDLLQAEEQRGRVEAEMLRTLAHLAGQHLAARLLDLTAQERTASAREIEAIRRQGGRASLVRGPGMALRH